jgi:hypothetical protein
MVHDGAGAFGGESATPEGECETPADFNGRHEGRFERWDAGSDEADKFSGFTQLGSVEAKSVTVEMTLDACDAGVGFFWCKQGWEVLHHAGIGVEGLKRLTVSLAPLAEEKAMGCQRIWHRAKANV